MEKRYGAYRALRSTIDEKVERLEKMHKKHMKCKAGCDLCCMDYSVFPIEFHYIKDKLSQMESEPKINTGAKDEDCIFLNDHICSIYEERPMICRTHGLPLLYMGNDNNWELSACELNFTGFDMEEFTEENTFPQDTFNSKLFMLNKTFINEFKKTKYKELELIPVKKLKEFVRPLKQTFKDNNT